MSARGAQIATIYALATAAGRGGVAVVRVSGPEALKSLQALSGLSTPHPRHAILTDLHDPASGALIDKALVLYFQAPASFTGEDVVEYHIHGGVAVSEALLIALSGFEGHRLAEPGEFTRRAFENGKMDLTEAEAVADLVNAETDLQRIQALDQLGGALSQLYEGWAERLTKALAHIEADIEFPDEDLEEGIAPSVQKAVRALADEISEHLNDNRKGERLRDGIHVAVIGAPNAGKSSFVNALAGRDVAIVSDMAGTTRDVIEVHLNIGGFPIIISDTAGLRPEQLGESAQDKVESEGIRRALAIAEKADILILMFDGSADAPDAATLALQDGRSLLVFNKSDLGGGALEGGVSVSAETGAGLDDVLKALENKLKQIFVSRETPSLTRKRHRAALEETHASLERALQATLPELTAEDVRLAVRALGRITGRVDVEDMLDVVFRDFCIGK